MTRDQRSGIRDQGIGNNSQAPCPIHATASRRMGGKAQLLIGRLSAAACVAALLFVAGCRQDMQDQPKIISQRGSEMFADHRGARPQVVNTVARGQLHEDSYFYTGVVQGPNGYREEKNEMPFPVTLEVLERGQERFNIYCTPCHSRVGNGLGEIVQRGYKPAANLHDQVRLSQPISHYFYVMTHGYGAMPDYCIAVDARGSLGGRGVYPRIAVEPGGQGRGCSFRCCSENAERRCGREPFARGLCGTVDIARDGHSGISARCQARHSRDGSGQSGGPGDQDS